MRSPYRASSTDTTAVPARSAASTAPTCVPESPRRAKLSPITTDPSPYARARAACAATIRRASPLTRSPLGVDDRSTALRAEDVEAAVDRIPARRVRALLGLDRLDVLEPLRVEAADDARIPDRDPRAPDLRVEQHDVRDARKRQARDDLARVAVEHDERAAVRGAEEATRFEPESV